MYYSQSLKILEAVKKANNILINVHRNPDLDSIGSATALFLAFKKIVIDHHKTNNFTDVNIRLLDKKASATAEIVYQLFQDWGLRINSDMATALFSGIAGDTVFFKYSQNTKLTFKIISDLLNKGAKKDQLIDQVFDSFDFNLVKMIGECLRKMEKGSSPAGEFVYSIMDYETYDKYGKQKGVRELVADLFARSIKGYNFGFIVLEEEKGKFSISFRSKKNTDVSVIAKKLGGGGHKNAAGVTVYGSKDEVIKKIIFSTSRSLIS